MIDAMLDVVMGRLVRTYLKSLRGLPSCRSDEEHYEKTSLPRWHKCFKFDNNSVNFSDAGAWSELLLLLCDQHASFCPTTANCLRSVY